MTFHRDRFDSNASASSSSNEGDSDEKKKPAKKAKIVKERKPRKRQSEVRAARMWSCLILTTRKSILVD